MKLLNKNKIVVSALALCIGASLAGSVSGTIAWYQYSTRANVSFIGQASGISGNLQMRFKGENDTEWRTRITWRELNDQLANDLKIVPMTFGAMDRDDAIPMDQTANPAPLGYKQPIAGVKDMENWVKATNKNYAQFTLQLRYNERDGIKEGQANAEKDEKNVAKDVYLSKLVIQPDSTNTANHKESLADAIRVHVSSSFKVTENNSVTPKTLNKLISNNGGTTVLQGKLDLDGDGKIDQAYPDADEFGFEDKDPDPANTTLQDVVYGAGEQNAYGNTDTYDATNTYVPYGSDSAVADPIHPALVKSEGNALDELTYTVGQDTFDKTIGTTIAGDENGYLEVTVTIWVEGWQKFVSGQDNQGQDIYSAIWDEVKYVDSSFDVGIQFAVQDAFVQE